MGTRLIFFSHVGTSDIMSNEKDLILCRWARVNLMSWARDLMSWEQDLISWERHNYVEGTRS